VARGDGRAFPSQDGVCFALEGGYSGVAEEADGGTKELGNACTVNSQPLFITSNSDTQDTANVYNSTPKTPDRRTYACGYNWLGDPCWTPLSQPCTLDLSRRARPLNTNTSNSKYLHTLYTLHQARTLPNPSDLRTTHSRSTRAVPPCCGRRSACHALRVRAAPARHQAAPRELAATDRPLRAPP
jgi:hypothetical protein